MDDRFSRRLAVVTLAALVLILAWRIGPDIYRDHFAPPAEPRLVTPRGDLAEDEKATIAVFRAARDSVVFITTSERVRDFWTRNVFEIPRGSGSGFVWDRRGHIVTNDHVIEGASAAVVQLADGRSYSARLVGRDPSHDLAVLRIDAEALPPPLPVGESATLEVGQTVLAIGNPFGLDWTLTKGIVSALGRELPASNGRPITGLVQTDAAINPGNSGGPLLDSAGRLIGVNTAIYSPSGASAGIGFAVPVDTVNRVVPELINTGRYTPPTLGIRYDPEVNALAARQGVRGVLVLDVIPGSPADAAGMVPARLTRDGRLVPGDVIVGLGGMPVDEVDDLIAALDRHRPGERVRVTLERAGERREVEVTLADGV
ncbi:serine protease, S1-C subfamily, contains C-terminal PDZ domain [Meinhardsimonia xiamenensis]|jgi:S1-C subfamily serine protease|uniref:Serine protease, S1-C subfamily, contains C-terminal PDZ domain n=1 Tax=Meinhardsimonia xiamenensis TaxID=990712 RepID=A0A1G9CS07_9RHOB|nr:trypsin-like peptidase domain-containing protein [Meinhardsimonia xiamenensis]PRX38268.1 S1-C subfamily serine protease [Meinhardsimonia xiamenensis]SDK54389.1 serine protease, S1-C subfamily, contains C-terminal PDZ domain [Meinhardsimonia xiamenensis]